MLFLKQSLFFGPVLILVIFASTSFKKENTSANYIDSYYEGLEEFSVKQQNLIKTIEHADLHSVKGREGIKAQIYDVRSVLKQMDFWFRYLEPISYKQINGPLPVEWETEVFEKFEKPYKRQGAGFTLAALYLEEENIKKDSLLCLIRASLAATGVYAADSVTLHLKDHHHFFLCNRLFLLNLAAIYTTGFECPEPKRIVPELRVMLSDVSKTYEFFNQSFSDTPLSESYLQLFRDALRFVNSQPDNHETFDHFTFVRDYVNPLFALNQNFIREYKVQSKSYMDYSLNKNTSSIFSKSLYRGQNAKGVYLRVYDEKLLAEIEAIGKLLFYDPILSGNNLRSCASCHKPTQHFTDTNTITSTQFDRTKFLTRNSPSLINAGYNHLLMADGKHISLQDQARAVISNPLEMACAKEDVLKKVLSCKEYKSAFTRFLKHTPQEKEIGLEHIGSALTLYYTKFSLNDAPFDEAMNKKRELSKEEIKGFNVYMSKAQCATCHFAPQFNGVKPPYVGSEFEVIGVPADREFKMLSADKGRYEINPAHETQHAFRTGTIRNAAKTKPYMHNGVFENLKEVIDFYDAGGGAGKGLSVSNQTLSGDSLHLTLEEKSDLIAFIHSLTENIKFDLPPQQLPASKIKPLNTRKVAGEY